MSKLEPCLGERRRPRLDWQGPLSWLKGMGSTVEVQGKPDEMRTAASADASTGFAGAANLCLQILGKHLAPLQHSKTCRCQFGMSASPVPSATAPTLAEGTWSGGGAGDVPLAGQYREQPRRRRLLLPHEEWYVALSVCSLPARGEKGLERFVVGEQSCHFMPHPPRLPHRRISTS